MPDLFDPFIADETHAVLRNTAGQQVMWTGNTYWRSRTQSQDNKRRIADTYICKTTGNIAGNIMTGGDLDATDECGNIVLVSRECACEGTYWKYPRFLELTFPATGVTPFIAYADNERIYQQPAKWGALVTSSRPCNSAGLDKSRKIVCEASCANVNVELPNFSYFNNRHNVGLLVKTNTQSGRLEASCTIETSVFYIRQSGCSIIKNSWGTTWVGPQVRPGEFNNVYDAIAGMTLDTPDDAFELLFSSGDTSNPPIIFVWYQGGPSISVRATCGPQTRLNDASFVSNHRILYGYNITDIGRPITNPFPSCKCTPGTQYRIIF